MAAHKGLGMTPTVQYPDHLPEVLFDGWSQTITDPTTRTTFASGRNRVRRNFTAVPVTHSVKWRFESSEHAADFEAWFHNNLKDGAEWFLMELRLPQGVGPWAFQFMGIYGGPNRIGPDIWEVSATIQQWLRAGD